MQKEVLVKSFFTGLIVAVIIFTVAAVIVLGLEALVKPYIVTPMISVLGSTGVYLEVLGARKSSSNLRRVGRLLIATGIITLALLIAKILEML